MRAPVALVLLGVCLCLPGCSSDTGEFEMTWSYGEPAENWPDRKHVVLQFADYHGYVIGRYSSDLGDYLDTLATDTVTVRFKVHRRLGCVHSYTLLSIGALKEWDEEGGYGGMVGTGSPSPWHHWPCWVEQ